MSRPLSSEERLQKHLARRSGEKTIPAQIHHEAQGMTAKKTSALDSTLNIRDGQGKVLDYVNYFKANGISRADADEQGLTARALGKKAYAIASNGSDSLIAAHRSNDLSDDGAVAIAEAAPGDERLQAVGIRAIQEGKTIAQAGNLVRAVKLMADEHPENTGDMFGFDDSGMREAEAMAKAATTHQRELQNRINAISGAAKRPDIAKQEGIKVGDSAAILRRVDELKAEKIAWDNWPTNPDLVAKIRADIAPAGYADGKVDYSLKNPLDEKYETDLFGEPLHRDLFKADGKGAPSAQPERTGLRGDAQPVAPVRDTQAPPGDYHANTHVAIETQRQLRDRKVLTLADAAHVTQYLGWGAVERLDGVVTDKEGNVLAVVGNFKGALAEAPVYPSTVMAEAIRVPDAANIWFSHNRPSGRATLSAADINLSHVLAETFRGSGIRSRGLVAVGDKRLSGHDQSHQTEGALLDSRNEATKSVPVY